MNRRAVASIARRYGIRSIVLFGSRARGDANASSDADVCVSAPRLKGDELALIAELSEALGADVDLCVYERASPSLLGTVGREGRRLYGTRETFERLRGRAIKEWQDSDKQVRAAGAFLDRVVG